MRVLLRWLVSVLVATPLSAQTAAVGPESLSLRPGDAVRITVWQREAMSGEFSIASDGTIAHPLYRVIHVAGVPLETVHERLRQFLRQFDSDPSFVLEPRLRISIGGEVGQPSLYTLPPETTVAQALAIAGGITQRGRVDRVRLIRDGEELLVDLTRPQAGLAQAPVRPGDQIFVDRRTDVFRDFIAPISSIASVVIGILNIVLFR